MCDSAHLAVAAEPAAEFHRFAVELVALTAGGAARGSTAAAASDAATAPLRRLERHAIAAATKVQYSHAELLKLIHEHLANAGLRSTAAALAAEARLPPGTTTTTTTTPALTSPTPTAPSFATHASTTPRLTLRGASTKKPGASAAGLFRGGSFSASAGTFTLGLTEAGEPAGVVRVETTTPAAPGESMRPPPPPPPSATPSAKRAKATKREDEKKTSAAPAPSPPPRRSRRTSASTPAPETATERPTKATGKTTSKKAASAAKQTRGSKRKAATPAEEKPKPKPKLVPPSSTKTKTKTKTEEKNPAAVAVALATPTPPPRPSSAMGLLAGAGAGSCYGGDRGNALTHMHFHAHGDRPGCGVKSRLDSIVTSYLRAQHRQCHYPISVCAPFSLTETHSCPHPTHPLSAPKNLSTRLARREWLLGHTRGGVGGRARDRHFVFGRFRPVRSMRDDSAMMTCAAFVGGDGDRVLAGSHEGELRLFDVMNGDIIEVHDGGHGGPIRTLRTSDKTCAKSLAISCGATEVQLWDVSNMGHGPTATFEGSCGGAFGANATKLAVVGEDLVGTVRLIDVATSDVVATLTPTPPRASPDAPAPRLPYAARSADVCFSPGDGGLLLWGHLLWDSRLPNPVRRFDRFSDGGGASFHPSGNEVVVNSEVWDLRSDRLLRSVPGLDGTQLCWTGTGDVAVASFRLPKEDPISTTLRRTKHPLRCAFRTVDASDYSEITTTEIERSLLDCCWDHGTDALCATVEYDAADTHDSVVRIHEVGRMRPGEEDSDAEDADEAQFGEGVDSDSEISELELAAMDRDDDDDDDDDVGEIEGDLESLAGLRALLGGLGRRVRGAFTARDEDGSGEDDGDDDEEDDEEAWSPDDGDGSGEEEEDFEDDDEDGEGGDDEEGGVYVVVDSEDEGESDDSDSDDDDDDDDDDDSESVLLSLSSEFEGETDEDEDEDEDGDSDGGDSGEGSGWLHG